MRIIDYIFKTGDASNKEESGGDSIIKRIEDAPTKGKRRKALKDLGRFLQRFEPRGDFENFKNTAIYTCFRHYYDFYLTHLSYRPVTQAAQE